MLIVEAIGRIRREHLGKGKSIKEIARSLHLSGNTVRRILRSGETALRGINRKDERLDPQAWLIDVLSRIAAHPGAGVDRLRRRESRRAHQNPRGIDADQKALKSTTSDAPLRPTPDSYSAS